MGKLLIFIFMLSLLAACNGKDAGLTWISNENAKTKTEYTFKVTNISHTSDGSLKVEGSNLGVVNEVKIKTPVTTLPLYMETQTPTTIYLKAKAALSLAMETTFEIIMTSSYAEQSFPITPSIANGSLRYYQLNSLDAPGADYVLSSDGNGNVEWKAANSYFNVDLNDICPNVTYLGVTYGFTMIGTDPKQAGTYCISAELVNLPFDSALNFCHQLNGDLCSPTELRMAVTPTQQVWSNLISHDGTEMIVTTLDNTLSYSTEPYASGNLAFYCCRR